MSWSKHPSGSLRGVVVELQSITLQEITDYLDHRVPVHYIHHDDQPSPYDARLLNAKDLDSEQAAAQAAFVLSRKMEKRCARDERRSTGAALPPRQKGKKIFALQDGKGRFKQVTKNEHGKLVGKYKGELRKGAAGDVDILFVDELCGDDDSDDDTPPLDYMFVPQKPWKSTEPEPGPSIVPDAHIPTARRRSPSVDDPEGLGWSATFPTHSLRPPRPPRVRSLPRHQRPGRSTHRRSRSPRRDQAPVRDERFRSRRRSPYVGWRHHSRSPPRSTTTPPRSGSPSRNPVKTFCITPFLISTSMFAVDSFLDVNPL